MLSLQRLVELRNQALVVGDVVLLIVLAIGLLLYVVVHVGSQDDNLGIVVERVVSSSTPNDVDVRIQLVEELRDLRQLRYEERCFLARVDIK